MKPLHCAGDVVPRRYCGRASVKGVAHIRFHGGPEGT